MKEFIQNLNKGLTIGLGFMIIVGISYIIIKATRSNINPGSDAAPNDLYVSEGETLKASKRNSLVDKSLSCPTGFTALSQNGSMLGCLQTTHNALTTCNTAIQNCWNNYGGRLPTYSEAYIGLNNSLVTIGSTDQGEWVDSASRWNNGSELRECGTIKKSPLSPTGSHYTLSRYYRCFIPR